MEHNVRSKPPLTPRGARRCHESGRRVTGSDQNLQGWGVATNLSLCNVQRLTHAPVEAISAELDKNQYFAASSIAITEQIIKPHNAAQADAAKGRPETGQT